jgi:hypothetical protein
MAKAIVWRWETRILVALPVIFVSLVLFMGVIAIELTQRAVTSRDPLSLGVVRLGLLGGGAALSIVFGVLAAVAIVRPVRQMMRTIRIHTTAALPDVAAAPTNELAALAQVLHRTLERFEDR